MDQKAFSAFLIIWKKLSQAAQQKIKGYWIFNTAWSYEKPVLILVYYDSLLCYKRQGLSFPGFTRPADKEVCHEDRGKQNLFSSVSNWAKI